MLLSQISSGVAGNSGGPSDSSSVTCAGVPLSQATELGSSAISGNISSASQKDLYHFSGSSLYEKLMAVYGLGTTLDVKLQFCNGSGTLIGTVDSFVARLPEQLLASFTITSTYYMLVSSYSGTGSYTIKTKSGFYHPAVSGGGSCSGFNGSECIDYDSDFLNPEADCTSRGSTYSSSSCSSTSRQGRCTKVLFSDSGANSGLISLNGYTDMYIDDDSFDKVRCTVAFGADTYLYNSSQL